MFQLTSFILFSLVVKVTRGDHDDDDIIIIIITIITIIIIAVIGIAYFHLT